MPCSSHSCAISVSLSVLMDSRWPLLSVSTTLLCEVRVQSFNATQLVYFAPAVQRRVGAGLVWGGWDGVGRGQVGFGGVGWTWVGCVHSDASLRIWHCGAGPAGRGGRVGMGDGAVQPGRPSAAASRGKSRAAHDPILDSQLRIKCWQNQLRGQLLNFIECFDQQPCIGCRTLNPTQHALAS